MGPPSRQKKKKKHLPYLRMTVPYWILYLRCFWFDTPKGSLQGELLGPRTIFMSAKTELRAMGVLCLAIVLPELPGAALLGKAYRCALSHAWAITSSTHGAEKLNEKEPEGTVGYLNFGKQIHFHSASKSSPPHAARVSILQASAPASTGSLLSHSDVPGYGLFSQWE